MIYPNSSSNVSPARPRKDVSGSVFSAPDGTTYPTSAKTSIEEVSPAFSNLGYISDSGITNSESRDTSSIFAWGGTEVDSVQTSRSETFAFTALETRLHVLQEAYNPDNVTVDSETGEIRIAHNSQEPPSRVFVFDSVLKDGTLQRVVVPKAKRTELGDVVWNSSEPIGYAITLAALPFDGEGNTAFTYLLPGVMDGEEEQKGGE